MAQEIDRSELDRRAAASLSSIPRPFIRWAGSKQRLLPQLTPFVPSSFGTYYEPFFGAGALFFALRPERARLSDACGPLIETYATVSSSATKVYNALTSMDLLDPDAYYQIRGTTPRGKIEQAARFLYLNRAGWNGLYRVNAKGEFNVPYGRPRSPFHLDLGNLKAAGRLLGRSSVSIVNSDFEAVAASAVGGDFAYFDPPYVTGHNNNGFVDYNDQLFSWADQVRLARLAARLQKAGVHVVVSNAHHKALLGLYPTFRVSKITRQSTLAGEISARTSVVEAVFHS